MVTIQYRLSVMFPDEYLYWLATVGEALVAPYRGNGLVSHRVLQSLANPQDLVILDEWDGEPNEMDYVFHEEIEGGLAWSMLTAGPDVTRFQERALDVQALGEALGMGQQEERPLL